MLTAETARSYIAKIEAIRAAASDGEEEVLRQLRAETDFEPNQDKDLLQAIEQRAEARGLLDDADTLIGSFDWVYDEKAGENRRKVAVPA